MCMLFDLCKCAHLTMCRVFEETHPYMDRACKIQTHVPPSIRGLNPGPSWGDRINHCTTMQITKYEQISILYGFI